MVQMKAVLAGLGLAALPLAAAQGRHAITGTNTGINRGTGELPVRRNIRDLATEAGPQWDLYIQAVSEMQSADVSDPLSYFQIAGIHGQPYDAWDGDQSTEQSSDWNGYCPHNEPKFMAWHRPYVALFEQAVVAKAKEIASRYPSNEIRRYTDAADTLRVPYWDWASEPNLPSVVTTPTVSIRSAPNGSVGDVRNPLYEFVYPANARQFGSLDGGDRTRRCSPGEANGVLSGSGLGSQVYNVFVRATDYETMASQQISGSSFESPHNTVHMRSSCGGEMGNPNIAAFDPLFMMHHANIDRLFAMWQAIYYQAPISFGGAGTGQFGTARSAGTTAGDPLKPFGQGSGGYHTSSSVGRVPDFGYTYPELLFWNRTADELAQDVKARVNVLYGGGQNALQKRDGPTKQYFAQLRVDRGMVPLPCEIKLYLGDQFAGSLTLLSIPAQGLSFGELPLPSNDDMADSDLAEDWFESNLSIEVVDALGNIIPVADDAVQIDVETTDREAPKDSADFPKFTPSKPLIKIGKLAISLPL